MTTVMRCAKSIAIRSKDCGPDYATTSVRSGVNKWFLSGYVAVFEWVHNLKVVTSECVAMMIVPFTPKPT